ncbi:folate biosynthesis protein [bacterium (Candidatus Blackallbacteria) CG17_big_fil_post_rev_8_21_14_2_50_48_46]|uniref:6-carboxy-5,6,7,8-tetrahydropterin synthase n=1 Tax=bacterium (Candidatus Blackallbacteria) CG17_big_fil_post_rev_8_21_14_2_50_48_46 TaxID=2014261 RepID=A0A2M7G0T0_9BACT|nr:MAG: folate biosynthesis protein [bacterium (Candidatus Blackallbacteria) CG18_big_fil_WC_8_21_14_2_50_49_26]PIW15315.1 MAG: folate biosynthesis protein [bacterium (Candidatus Blackallbacteria) CG17_big_fil_post_rev_8_21_14_2_50_48_46]PIW45175.1 MAG: folate biosynthesis protein [bacterium (Candidatus Blackallbacteria) CG13_big_fil_rev_8_21_14_2_50_49_14]
MRTVTLELFKENMKFSAGHFTIFSAQERENLHGHNFTVHVTIEACILENGMCFDYALYKRRIEGLCREWNEVVLLPSQSPYLRIEETDDLIFAHFDTERIPFLRRDVLLLPIENATVEEFSRLFLEKLIANPQELSDWGLEAISVKIFSGPGQCAASSWKKPEAHAEP